MSSLYVTYYAKKHKAFITRMFRYDKPDGTPSQRGLYIDKSGQSVLNYWRFRRRWLAKCNEESADKSMSSHVLVSWSEVAILTQRKTGFEGS